MLEVPEIILPIYQTAKQVNLYLYFQYIKIKI